MVDSMCTRGVIRAITMPLLFLVSSVMGFTADGSDDAEITARVDDLFAKWTSLDVPGCAVGVVQDGKLIYAEGFGSANLDHEVPNTPQTIFEIGSMAKSFTCACIALLLDEGKISPDDDIRTYLPEMQAFDVPVRIRHLIRCESGLWAQWHLVQLAGWSSEPVQTPYDDKDFLALLSGQKTLPFEPGTQFRYGSSDYFLLGIIIERVTGRTLAEFARERIFEPLGMDHTFYQQDATDVVRNRAVGYYSVRRNSEDRWRAWTSNSAGSGGWNLKTCVDDLVRWEQNFLNNRLPEGQYLKEFLSEGTLLNNRNVLDATPTGTYRGAKRIQFTGGMPGFVAAFTRLPDQRFAVCCLSNNSDINPWKTSSRIADMYLGDQLAPEPKPATTASRREQPIELPGEELRNKVGTFRSEHGHYWKLAYSDGKLWNTNHFNETYILHPLSATRFRPEPYPEDTFAFHQPKPDEPFILTLEYDGGTVKFDRIELLDPSSVQLDDYVGDYHSAELLITYRFAIKENALWVRVGNRRWERLDPTVRDEFIPHVRQSFDNRIFTFLRDEAKTVVGVSVVLWRVKGVRFDRRPARL